MDSQVNADGWRLKFWMCDLWPTIETVLRVSNRDFVCMFSYTRLISAEYLHTYYTLWSDEVWQHAPNPNELFLKGKVSVHQTFVMLFSLSPFGRDHLAFGAGMQGRPWTRTTNIYLSQALCEYSPQLCKHEWMYIWSLILYAWIFIYNDKVKLTDTFWISRLCLYEEAEILIEFVYCLFKSEGIVKY